MVLCKISGKFTEGYVSPGWSKKYTLCLPEKVSITGNDVTARFKEYILRFCFTSRNRRESYVTKSDEFLLFQSCIPELLPWKPKTSATRHCLDESTLCDKGFLAVLTLSGLNFVSTVKNSIHRLLSRPLEESAMQFSPPCCPKIKPPPSSLAF